MTIQPIRNQTSNSSLPEFLEPLVHVTIAVPLDPLKGIQVGIWPIQHTYKIETKPAPVLLQLWRNLYKKSSSVTKNIPVSLDLRGKAVIASTNIDGLGANRVGKGLIDRFLIAASHPDQEPNLEVFWKAIINRDSLLVDLTERDLNYAFRDKFKDIHIKTVVQVKKPGWEETTYAIYAEEFGQEIERIHYSDWMDDTTIPIDRFEQLVHRLYQAPQKAIWVHCKEGIGRTAMLLIGLILKEKISKNDINLNNLSKKICDFILQMRTERHCIFVYKYEQFQFLVNYGNFLLSKNS